MRVRSIGVGWKRQEGAAKGGRATATRSPALESGHNMHTRFARCALARLGLYIVQDDTACFACVEAAYGLARHANRSLSACLSGLSLEMIEMS